MQVAEHASVHIDTLLFDRILEGTMRIGVNVSLPLAARRELLDIMNM